MAVFFFHFFDGVERCEDDMGLELCSSEDAYLEAVATARDMWVELLNARKDPSRCSFDIADHRQQVLFQFRFSELLDRCDVPRSGSTGPSASLAKALKETHMRAAIARATLADSLEQVRMTLQESNLLLSRLTAIGDAKHSRRMA